jgi:heme exporter protein B
MNTRTGFTTLMARDMQLALRRPVDGWLPVVFFVVSASLFPLGVGPEPQTLKQIGAGVIWVCALLSAMMALGTLYTSDHADGSLEQMLLSGQSMFSLAAAKALVHWIVTGLPLVLVGPLLGLLFGMGASELVTLTAGLLLGTPVLSLIGGVGAALTLGLNSGGALLLLLVLPLCIPILIFGAGAVSAVEAGISPAGNLSLLGAMLLVALVGAPAATATALRLSLA